jgi:toxin ParE1/3/4
MTERKVVLRPSAEDDLLAIYRYISRQSGNSERAIGYIRRIRARCEDLRRFPEAGRARNDLRPGVRILGFERRVVVAYTVLPSGDVEIGRFFYGGRDYEALRSGNAGDPYDPV